MATIESTNDLNSKHQEYLLQGVLNFFMDKGKVALVSYADATVQAEFEHQFEQMAQEHLGCKIMHLQANAQTDELQLFNSLLAKIPLATAAHRQDGDHANYLLWISELPRFNQERLEVLKNILLQLPGLGLKLFISLPSSNWDSQAFGVGSRKIAYWHVPSANAQAVAYDIPEEPPSGRIDPVPATPTLNRKPHIWFLALGFSIVISALVYLQNHSAAWPGFSLPAVWSSPHPARTDDSNSIADHAGSRPDDEHDNDADKPALQASDSVPQPSRLAPSTPIAVTPALVATASAASSSAPKPVVMEAKPSASQTEPQHARELNKVDDCVSGGEFPVLKPVSVVKNTNYIYLKSPQSITLCVAHSGGPFKLVRLQANNGFTVYGNPPWRLYSPDLSKIEVFAQGAKVYLKKNIVDRVEVIHR